MSWYKFLNFISFGYYEKHLDNKIIQKYLENRRQDLYKRRKESEILAFAVKQQHHYRLYYDTENEKDGSNSEISGTICKNI